MLAAVLLLVLAGAPAYAAFTSYRTVVTGITPATDGLTATATLNGEQLTVSNTSAQEVIVDGYQGEPYLRITSAGVWQNDLSPAVYLNKEQTIGNIPKDANADQPPQWTRIDDGHRASWHDHRIHWMGATEPPAVAADPHSPHLVNDWTIPIAVGGATGEIDGTLSYEPPSRLGTYLTYGGIAAAVVVVIGLQVLVLRRRRAVPTARGE